MQNFFSEKDAKRLGKIVIMIAFFAALLLVTKFLHESRALSMVGSDITKVSTIDVTGKGEVFAIPDVAEESFTVEQRGATVAEAQAVVSKKVNDALAFLKKSGVAEKDIKTTNYSANPEYSYPAPCYSGVCPSSAPKITGYTVSETVTVKVRDTGAVGKIVDGLGAAGITGFSGPNFMVDDTDKINADARKQAIEDAEAKAKVLAKDLGVRLIRIVRYSDNNGGGYPMPMYTKAMDSMSAGSRETSMPTGENKYVSNVTITYEIR